jgi:hypothetical protein
MGDTFFNPDPTGATHAGDVFMNTLSGGDVWFDVISQWTDDTAWDILNSTDQDTAWDILNATEQDVAWDILNAWALNTAWDILNSTDQNTSWSVFAKTLYYIQQFFVKQISFDFNIKEPIGFDWSMHNPLEFTYKPKGSLDSSIYILNSAVIDTVHVASPIDFGFQIMEPLKFTFYPQSGEITEYVQKFNVSGVRFDYSIIDPLVFSASIRNPITFTYKAIGVLDTTINVLPSATIDPIEVSAPVCFDFKIKTPPTFTFGIQHVMMGESDTINRND